MTSYCDYAPGDPLHGPYHDQEYGFPARDEAVLFERLILEINQAGLNWGLMLQKREGFRAAYDGFQVERVAGYGETTRGNHILYAIMASRSTNEDADLDRIDQLITWTFDTLDAP